MITVVDRDTGAVLDRRGRANLHLPGKGRLYVFEWTARYVGVRKYLGDRCVEDKTYSVGKARSLWAWLVKIGYVRV